ncbi:MAG: hypothetical protein WC637_09390 [Victivallales bacterium]
MESRHPTSLRSYAGQASQTLGAAPLRAVTGFATTADLSAAGGIHKNLSPFRLRWDATPGQVGLRIFLAQERMFLSRRIYSIRLPPSLGSYGGTGRSEILFELSKIFRPPRRTPDANF